MLATVVGEAKVGGRFILKGNSGEKIDSEAFKGKYLIVYFGYGHCPDICPMGLNHLKQALQSLDKKKRSVTQTFFISVDPERDTPEFLKDFALAFDNYFIGLTGNKQEITKIAKDFKVYVAHRKDLKQGSDKEYLVDHSSIFYILDQQHKYIGHFSHDTPVEQVAKLLDHLIKVE